MARTAPKTIAILIYDLAEEMDFAGPLEVLAAAAALAPDWRVLTVAATADMVTCEKGLQVVPNATIDALEQVDVIVLPGGSGAKNAVHCPETIAWLQRIAPTCTWITSVCTGTFLLVGSGLAKGRKTTTHHAFYAELGALPGTDVVEGVRMVRDGNIVSAGGVMSGIEMSLWLAGQLWGDDAALHAKDYIAYDLPPRASMFEVS